MNERDNRALRFFTYVAGVALIITTIVLITIAILALSGKL